MRINDLNRIQGTNPYQKMNQKNEELKKNLSKKDQIQISDEAKQLLEMTKDVSSNEKVNQLKEQIKDGTYQVDSRKVADKLLDWLK